MLYHASDLLGFRFMNDWANRTVSGFEAGSGGDAQGVMEDHAERKLNRTGLQVELTPGSKVDVTFTYFRNNADYPNRPNKATNIDSTQGLLSAKYDSFTGEVGFHPNAKVELDAYYTYEKNDQTNQWVTLVERHHATSTTSSPMPGATRPTRSV